MEDKTITVLIVDDNKGFRDILSEFIGEVNGISVVGTAKDGIEAINMIRSLTPDVVVLDIIMPQIDGIGVLENIKSSDIKKQPKFIMLSALGQDNITQKALALGASYYVVKPFDLNVLVSRIRDLSVKSETQFNSESNDTSMIVSESYNSSYIASKAVNTGTQSTNSYSNTPSRHIADSREIEFEVTKAMHDIGIPAHIKGYQYLRDAIILSIEDNEMINYVTKRLYPCIAKNHSTTPSRVERAIRHAIEVAWNRGQVEVFDEIFGYSINSGKGKPTNSEFIAMIADRLRLQYR